MYYFNNNCGDSFIKTFSKSIFIKCVCIAENNLDAISQKRILESVDNDIRKVTDLCIPESSKAAAKEFLAIGIDYTKKRWQDQPKFDNKRELFFLEHYLPVNNIRRECLNAKSEEEIEEILWNRPRLIWILRKENERLNALGYGRKRDDPAKAYREAGIEIIIDIHPTRA
jgi:hypothetical protein